MLASRVGQARFSPRKDRYQRIIWDRQAVEFVLRERAAGVALADIATVFGVVKERIRQVISKAEKFGADYNNRPAQTELERVIHKDLTNFMRSKNYTDDDIYMLFVVVQRMVRKSRRY